MRSVGRLIAVGLLLVANSVAAARTDRELRGLKGPVGSERIETASLSDKLIEGSRERSEKRIYDSKGNLAWETFYKSDSVISSRFYYSKTSETQEESAHVRQPRNAGVVPRPTVITTHLTWTHKYDATGNRIDSLAVTPEGTRVRQLVYNWDQSGKLIGLTEYGPGGERILKFTYSYDAKGSVKQRDEFDRAGVRVASESYSYEYDAQENWVKRVTSKLTPSGSKPPFELVQVSYRQITYYPPLGAFQSNGAITPAGVARPASGASSDANADPGATGILAGKAVKQIQPAYPAAALAARISGIVIVEVTVDEEGDVLSARAVAGHPLLREAALEAAWDWKFSPTIYEGRPIKVVGSIVFRFNK